MSSIERFREELEKYEHPFFQFEAHPKDEGVEMIIRLQNAGRAFANV